MASEWARIDKLRAALAGAAGGHVLVGIGDDAAVLAPGAEPLVWTIDVAVEGVHFRRDWLSLADIGYRATMAAASDLAAMGATPLALLASLVLPADVDDDGLLELVSGQRAAADALGTAVIGGNLARGSELSITTTALGSAPRPLTRSGAHEGDVLWVAGPLGLAGAGLVLLRDRAPVLTAAAVAAVAAFRRPTAQLVAGVAARDRATAAIDVSDGLAQDVGHVARASGLRAVLDLAGLVASELAEVAAELSRDALELALHGGEDYAVVVALPPGVTVAGFRRIGSFEKKDAASDVALRHPDGLVAALEERGHDHFRDA